MISGLVLLLALTQASGGGCNAKAAGAFRPEAANYDRDLARRLLHAGELEVCTFTGWKYKWRKANVSVERLREEKARNETRSPL